MSNKIRFGITGSGFMGQTHAEAILAQPDAELVAVAVGSRAPALAARHKVVCEPSASALIARKDIDAIVITTPHHVHIDEALPAIESGKHVLIEKPMATKVEDCDRMIHAAQTHGVNISVGYQQRFRTNNAKAWEVLRSGAIGKISTFQISMPCYMGGFKSGGFGSTWDWWDNPESVGHIINSGPHAIDLMRWLTGAEVATVSAFSRTFTPTHTVEDTTLALLRFSGSEFSNQMIGFVFSSSALPSLSFPGEDFRIRITGTKGVMDLDAYKDLCISDEAGWRKVSTQPTVGFDSANTAFGPVRMEAYNKQVAAFIGAIRGTPGGAGTALDGRAGVETVLAMLTSSRDRRWVDISGAPA